MHEKTERRSPTRWSYRLKRPLGCAECGELSSPDAPGWRGGRIDEPETDDLPAVAFYCPECWQAEFV
jgi:hypothetical protein